MIEDTAQAGTLAPLTLPVSHKDWKYDDWRIDRADRTGPSVPLDRPCPRDFRPKARMDRARTLTQALGADALLVDAGASLRYFTGLPWGQSERLVSMLLAPGRTPIMICPHFEIGTLEADLAVPVEIRSWQEDEDPVALVIDALREIGARTLAIDPELPFHFAERIRAAGTVGLVDAMPVIKQCRMVKSAAELALMQQAKAMTLVVQHAAARILHPGIRQSEVVRFIDAAHRRLGASGSSFCIVQFGEATAYPHGLPGDRALEEGQLCSSIPAARSRAIIPTSRGPMRLARSRRTSATSGPSRRKPSRPPSTPCAPAKPVKASTMPRARCWSAPGWGPTMPCRGCPSHRPWHRPVDPRTGLSGARRPHRARTGMCFSNEPMIVVPGRLACGWRITCM
jgi:Xaa-Pro dipeptidase